MSAPPHRLIVTSGAARGLTTKLRVKVAAAVYAFIIRALVEQPRRVGKPLGAPLAPAWCARRGDYRVLYLIDDASRTVTVTAVRHRADAYRS